MTVYKDCLAATACGSRNGYSCRYIPSGIGSSACGWNPCPAITGNGLWQTVCSGIDAFDLQGPCNVQLAQYTGGQNSYPEIFKSGFNGLWATYSNGRHFGDNVLSFKLSCAGSKNRIVCKDTSMEIYLDPRTVITNMTTTTLRNSSCFVKRYLPSNEYGFVTGFKECGTTIQETATHITYENEVNFGRVSGSITRSNLKQILFSCSMPRHSDVNVNQLTVPVSMVNETDAGYGTFTITLSMFLAADFSAKVSSFPATVNLDSRIYFEALVTSQDQSVVLLIEKCSASPTMDKNHASKHNLITNRCAVDSTVQFHSSASPHRARFSFQSFAFVGQNNAVYIHCQVFMCHKQSTDSRCTTGCQGNNINRARRSVGDELLQRQQQQKSIERREIPVDYLASKEINLSIGPLVQKSTNANSGKTDNAKGFSAVHGMGVGLGVVGLAAAGFAVRVALNKHKKRKHHGDTKDDVIKPTSNEGFEMEA
eukprot:gene12286-13551_t